MNWNRFNTFGESPNKAFEIFVNQIFKFYCKKTYNEVMKKFVAINGSGGDGGIEAYAELNTGSIICVQSKYFRNPIETSELNQIKKSINTAIHIRNNIEKYIVCVPRDLANKKNGTKLSEREKVEKIFEEYEDTDIDFVVWGDFELCDFMTKQPELASIHKFWFENSEIDFSSIKEHFDVQKNSYLKEKYDKNVHVISNINCEIKRFMGDVQYKKEQVKKAKKIKEVYEDYILMLKKYSLVADEKEKNILQGIIDKQSNIVEECIQYIESTISYLRDEDMNINNSDKDFYIDTEWFCDIEKDYSMSSHYNELKMCIKTIQDTEIYEFIQDINSEYQEKNLIIVGDLGTGKTHGVVNQIEYELERNNIAIFIRASAISKNTSWKDIFINELGLSNNWSEEEIFYSLELLADQNNYIDEGQQEIKIYKKVLICFDGIDEHSDYDYWYTKQLEAQKLCEKYKHLRFCFIGRKYAFPQKLKNLGMFKLFDYDFYPGYDMEELCRKYTKKYNVTFDKKMNIRAYLNSPLEMKLFCEINKNKKIKSLNNIQINLPQLFSNKLNSLNLDFCKSIKDCSCNSPINRAAKIMGEYLYYNDKIKKSKIFQLMDQDEELNLLDNNQKKEIISYLQKLGMLHTEIITEELGIQTEEYYKGIQPVNDYIMAKKMSEHIKNMQFDEIRKEIKDNEAIVKLCALIIFEEEAQYLMENKNLDIKENILNEATIYTIIHANSRKIVEIVDKVKKYIKKSPQNMRRILNKIIIPCSRIENHPLGAKFLNDILKDYSNMAERDRIWSLPHNLENSNVGITDEIVINPKNMGYCLNQEDRYNGLPLIYAWLLTGVDNSKLYFYRNELMKWALLCPSEFVLLFREFNNSNDMQQVEQLYGIAMCLCYRKRK